MSLLLLFRPRGGDAPVEGEPGGGGMGAVMHPRFFERYHAKYEPKPLGGGYKPTLRKQR